MKLLGDVGYVCWETVPSGGLKWLEGTSPGCRRRSRKSGLRESTCGTQESQGFITIFTYSLIGAFTTLYFIGHRLTQITITFLPHDGGGIFFVDTIPRPVSQG
jgi:hypothetical protein